MLQALDIAWRSTLVRLPRAVPTQVLYWTNPEGPYPHIIELPSRGKYKIPLYIFIKKQLALDETARLPVVLDFHGGGFVLGSCLEQAPFCSQAARDLGAVVISVDYRMGPYYQFPAALEDAEDVLRAVLHPETPAGMALRAAVRKIVLDNWATLSKPERKKLRKQRHRAPLGSTRQGKASPALSVRTASTTATPIEVNLDPSRIAFSGFSSGGNVALNLALSLDKSRDGEDWPSVIPKDYSTPIPLLLYYPSFDARQLPSERTLPKNLPPGSPFWAQNSDVLAPSYLPRNKAGHPRASPGLADLEGLHKMARIILVLSGLDSLAEQSEVWVKKVSEHHRSNDLQIERYPERKHGWTQMPDGWLTEDEKKDKNDIYKKTNDFTQLLWKNGQNDNLN